MPILLKKELMTPMRSPEKDGLWSAAQPSTWWNSHRCVTASIVSLRKTRSIEKYLDDEAALALREPVQHLARPLRRVRAQNVLHRLIAIRGRRHISTYHHPRVSSSRS